MSLSTYLINYNYEIYERVSPYLARFESEEKRDVDLHIYRDHAIVVGYDEIIRAGLPLLQEQFGDVVVIDRNPAHAEIHQTADYDYIYGDFKHGEIRSSAGLKRAAFVLSSTVEPAINRTLLEEVGNETVIFAEADSTEDAAELYERGAHYVILSTLLTSEKLSEHLQQYFNNPEEFWTTVDHDIGHLRWVRGEYNG